MRRFLILAIAFAGGNALANGEVGKIQICRYPGIVGLMDGKKVSIPEDYYTGSCDKNGEKCRTGIRLKGQPAMLGASKGACVVVEAELVTSDNRPVGVGEAIRPQWSIAGFEPIIKVVSAFK